jgi:hypothetical protein
MTPDDKEALRELRNGLLFGIAVVGGIIMFVAIFGTFRGSDTPEKKFQVVDRYKNCDVVRYTDPTQRWEYFLHCEP